MVNGQFVSKSSMSLMAGPDKLKPNVSDYEAIMRPPRLLLLVLFLAPWSLLHAADWPQWGGTPSKNMVSPERHLPETFVPGEKGTQGEGILLATARNVRWAARLGNFSCGTPTVARGKVFIGGMVERQGVLKCFDEATGKLLWQWIKPCRSDLKEDGNRPAEPSYAEG
jgi:hypothetical protein